MEQSIKMTPLITDLRMMEGVCYLPILVYGMIVVVILIPQIGFVELMSFEQIKQLVGIIGIPSVSFWIIHLYKNIVSNEMKEVILSLPYTPLQFGLLRVLRMLIIYICIFYGELIYVMFWFNKNIGIKDLLLPLIGIIFFAAISFVAVLLIKNKLFTYVAIGFVGTYEYVTRGGLTGWFYPFEWVLNRPYYSGINIIILLTSSVILFLLGQWISTKREYLIK